MIAAVVALTAAMVAAGPAYAHSTLISTSPDADETVPTIPTEVVLTFNEPAMALGTRIVVTGPAGPVQSGDVKIIDKAVVQALEPGSPAGRYTVDWRVASADGHPVTGSYSFTVAATSTTSPTATATPSATPTSAVTSDPPYVDTGAPATEDGSAWTVGIAVVIAAVLIIGLITVGLFRRRESNRRLHS